MRGSKRVRISNNKVKYDFVIRRNVTIIQGDSATGKTTLMRLIKDSLEDSSSVTLVSDAPCAVIDRIRYWKKDIESYENTILFFDENCKFVNSMEFADMVNGSSNYFVIVSRVPLKNLAYSTEEIYHIIENKKYPVLKKTFNVLINNVGFGKDEIINPDILIVEDSNFGYEFFKKSYEGKLKCVSSEGKSNIQNCLRNYSMCKRIAVIVDGAAFGCEIEKVVKEMNYLEERGTFVLLILRESFEYSVLVSNFFTKKFGNYLRDYKENIDSEKYFSWERFFTRVLADLTRDTDLVYSKSRFNRNYLNEKVKNSILSGYSCIVIKKDGELC